MFSSYLSKDIQTKYSYKHVHSVLIKEDRINKNASFSRPAEQSFGPCSDLNASANLKITGSFGHTVPASVLYSNISA